MTAPCDPPNCNPAACNAVTFNAVTCNAVNLNAGALAVILGIATCLFPTTAEAKYIPLTFAEMIGASDLVLVVQITKLEKSGPFVARVDDVLAGKYKAKTIEVEPFRNWACASRWAPYAVDQKLLLCLRVLRKGDSVSYRIRSGGGEGEMPIKDGWVFCRGRGAPPSEDTEIRPAGLSGSRQKLTTVKDAIRRFRSCFRFKPGKNVWTWTWEQICDEAELAKFRARSAVHESLAVTATQ